MANFDYKCRVVEEELQSFWPGWHVVARLGGGTYGDVFQIYKVDNTGIRTESALKVIQIVDNNLSDPTPPESVLSEQTGRGSVFCMENGALNAAG